jgi:sporulation protein YlmC with PRC-barrel domain
MATLSNLHDTAGRLISAANVHGTDVYNIAGEKLGIVDTVMIDKQTGRIAYAVLSFGGFLGIGDKHHPMPWQTLRYDTGRQGYVVDLDHSMREGAPVYGAEDRTTLDDEAFGRRVHDYYGVEPFWSSVI